MNEKKTIICTNIGCPLYKICGRAYGPKNENKPVYFQRFDMNEKGICIHFLPIPVKLK